MTAVLLMYAVFVAAMAALGGIVIAPWFAAFIVALGLLHMVFPALIWWHHR